jgi:hypothetical protein
LVPRQHFSGGKEQLDEGRSTNTIMARNRLPDT